jgi:hypothetical protein
LTIELTPSSRSASLRSCSELTYLTSPENNSLRSRAPELHSTKDTLLTLNTCIRCSNLSLQPYNVLGLVLRHPGNLSFQPPHGRWYEE